MAAATMMSMPWIVARAIYIPRAVHITGTIDVAGAATEMLSARIPRSNGSLWRAVLRGGCPSITAAQSDVQAAIGLTPIRVGSAVRTIGKTPFAVGSNWIAPLFNSVIVVG